MIRITTFAGRRVAVFGLGASGIATAKALVEGGADVVCSDDNAAGVTAAAEAGLKTGDLKDANWAVFSALVVAPGVPLTHPAPHWAVRAAKLAGVEVIGDLELFCRERRLQNFDVPLICITGTNGKSTTTALTAHILKEAGRDTEVGGNIGTAMLSLGEFKPGRHYVIECSSYQIDLAPSLDPTVGVLLRHRTGALPGTGPVGAAASRPSRVPSTGARHSPRDARRRLGHLQHRGGSRLRRSIPFPRARAARATGLAVVRRIAGRSNVREGRLHLLDQAAPASGRLRPPSWF
jgi:UDP-N-acetylmuramoylalanine--D-glutamate ligase